MPSPPLTINFNWTASGSYPAGSQPWSGQPLALAPANTYMTPDVKPPAEEINYEFGQIATDLANINTYLAHMLATDIQLYTSTTANIVVPTNCNWMGALLCGGGGAGECANTAELPGGSAWPFDCVQGGGGAGAPLIATFFPTVPGDKLTATVGGGGVAGLFNGLAGTDGGDSSIVCTSGFYSGTTMALARGASGCGCGIDNTMSLGTAVANAGVTGSLASPGITNPQSPEPYIHNGSYMDQIGMMAPGAVGTAAGGHTRMFPFGFGPGGAVVIGGVLQSVYSLPLQKTAGGDYDLGRFAPRIAQRGGSVYSVWTGGSALFVRGALAGQDSNQNCFGTSFGGGSPGTTGANAGGGAQLGGAGGGGGGAGPFGPGGAGGNGAPATAGASSSSQNGGNGAAAGANTGAGGGGGGGAGQAGSGTAALGGNAGNGGSGLVILFRLSGPPTPP